jgi:two-component system, chemotaxis family, chemotaxis protein CheY
MLADILHSLDRIKIRSPGEVRYYDERRAGAVPYNVLIVDDSLTMRKVIRKSVAISGFDLGDCWEAGNGHEALAVLQSQKVDLILTDLNMPEMDGLELTRVLEKDEKTRNIPVVFITTHGPERIPAGELDRGSKGFIQKPFHPEAIRDVLRQVLEKKHG